MEKKFYREINANSIKEAKLEIPSKDELQVALVEKLREKTEHINVLINNSDRESYLLKKNKFEESKKYSEQEIKSLLAKRLIVDMFQLFSDLQRTFNENLKITLSLREGFNEEQIQKELFWCCDKLLTKKTKSEIFEEIAINLFSLSNLYGFTLDEIENERKRVEEKEGNYYNGKYVII